jgi:carbon-monoxide dehydrogenase medium subunit
MAEAERYTPETLDEVAALLLAADGGSRPEVSRTAFLAEAAGPTGSVPLVVDVKRVPEMNRVEYDERGGLLVGAAVPLSEPLRLPVVRRAYAILVDATGTDAGAALGGETLGQCLGGPQGRADLAVSLICLGASAAVFGPHGWSEMTLEALWAREGETALQAGEFLVDVRLPAPSPRSGGAHVRWAAGAAAAVEVGAFLVMQDDLETCCGARLAVRTGEARPLRVPDAERFLQGRRLDETAVRTAGDIAAQLGEAENRSRPLGDRKGALAHAARLAIVRALERAGARPETDSDTMRR